LPNINQLPILTSSPADRDRGAGRGSQDTPLHGDVLVLTAHQSFSIIGGDKTGRALGKKTLLGYINNFTLFYSSTTTITMKMQQNKWVC